MRELLTGHSYELAEIVIGEDGKDKVAEGQATLIHFMKKEDGKIVMAGTTNEEVLAMMIARMQYLQDRMPCQENVHVLFKLEEALMWLERRTQRRIQQGVEGKDEPHKS